METECNYFPQLTFSLCSDCVCLSSVGAEIAQRLVFSCIWMWLLSDVLSSKELIFSFMWFICRTGFGLIGCFLDCLVSLYSVHTLTLFVSNAQSRWQTITPPPPPHLSISRPTSRSSRTSSTTTSSSTPPWTPSSSTRTRNSSTSSPPRTEPRSCCTTWVSGPPRFCLCVCDAELGLARDYEVHSTEISYEQSFHDCFLDFHSSLSSV